MRVVLLFVLFCFCANARAEDVVITADDRVEWHNNEEKMVAIGNAVASKGGMKINADRLEGFYQEVNGRKDISKVFGFDNVVLVSEQTQGFGDKLEYDVKKDEAILIGSPAKIKTPTEEIEAEDKLYYYPSKKQAIARGGVKAVSNEGNTMYADVLEAYFKESNNSSMELAKVDVFGNIKIVTKDATITADEGTYFPDSGEVHLFDNVYIYQGDNKMAGDKAVANLRTGVSKLVAGSKGKVKGSFKAKE